MREPKEVIINGKTLEEILTNHMYWVNSGSVEEHAILFTEALEEWKKKQIIKGRK